MTEGSEWVRIDGVSGPALDDAPLSSIVVDGCGYGDKYTEKLMGRITENMLYSHSRPR